MSKKHVLIVEDDKDILEVLKDLLMSEEYRVSTAENGKVALSFLSSTPTLPGLILLDLMMPEMDGFQFREKQALDERFKQIPVVVMTADGHIEAKLERIKAHVFLKKPLDLENVLETIAKFF